MSERMNNKNKTVNEKRMSEWKKTTWWKKMNEIFAWMKEMGTKKLKMRKENKLTTKTANLKEFL